MTESPNAAPAPKYFDTPFPNAPVDCGGYRVIDPWIDYNGHMNVGYYGVAFDKATDVLFDHWLDLGEGYVSREGMGPFALQSHAHYLNELRLGEAFRVTAQLLDHDHKRVHLFAAMIRVSDGAIAATNEYISMNIDLTARRSTPYPERQRRRVEALWEAHKDLPPPERAGAPIGLRKR